jgi:hypothetical protein
MEQKTKITIPPTWEWIYGNVFDVKNPNDDTEHWEVAVLIRTENNKTFDGDAYLTIGSVYNPIVEYQQKFHSQGITNLRNLVKKWATPLIENFIKEYGNDGT